MSDPYLDQEVAGQFRIVEKIGKGGMGAVYKAEQPDMNRYVAIKILHSRYLSRSDLVSRFRREARAMSQLSHPNTARVFLYGQLDDGACYFVMEHLVGQNLAQLVHLLIADATWIALVLLALSSPPPTLDANLLA